MSQDQSKKAGFLNHIHNFRGVAILFVVGGHILLYWKPDDFSHKFIESIFQNGTVLFVFIAGYLFQYLSRKYNTQSYWLKKIKYVLVPYLLVSVPALALRLYHTPYEVLQVYADFGEWEIWRQVVWYLTTGGHLKPLWFIPMITIFYLIAPVLIFMDRHPRSYWALPLLVALSLIVPRGDLTNIFRMFLHFLSVYIFGMFFSRYDKTIHTFSAKGYIIFTLLTVAVTTISLFKTQHYDTIMYIQKMLLCWFFMYWLKQVDRYIPKLFALLAEYSFGIFFLHYYFLLILKFIADAYFPSLMEGSVLNWLIHFMGIVNLNILFIYLIKLSVRSKSRYLIGC